MILNGRYFIDDFEFGFVEVSKEYYEEFYRMMFTTFKLTKPVLRVENHYRGSIIIYGTAGDTTNEIKNIFYDPENFKT